MKFHIGCSSYYNSKWIGIFYPESIPRKQWFEYYCQHFDTYELNATFYRFPTLKSLQNWYDKSPESFLFSVKAPKTITHIKKFSDCRDEINAFYKVCSEGFREKLANILFQLPPSFTYSTERLELIISQLDPSYNNVVEFRNESWWRPEVFDVFHEHNITFCTVNYPKLPQQLISTTSNDYVRMHGNPKLFYSEYDDETLSTLNTALLDSNAATCFVYFNNTVGIYGILDALKMKKL